MNTTELLLCGAWLAGLALIAVRAGRSAPRTGRPAHRRGCRHGPRRYALRHVAVAVPSSRHPAPETTTARTAHALRPVGAACTCPARPAPRNARAHPARLVAALGLLVMGMTATVAVLGRAGPPAAPPCLGPQAAVLTGEDVVLRIATEESAAGLTLLHLCAGREVSGWSATARSGSDPAATAAAALVTISAVYAFGEVVAPAAGAWELTVRIRVADHDIAMPALRVAPHR